MAYKDWQKLFDMEKDGAVKEALGKQIPKRPIMIHEDDQEEYYCPACDEWLTWDGFKPKHCMECGQAIDWSENR